MAGESSRYLLEVDIDWSQGKASTAEFIGQVQARIAELEALAGKTKAQGGLNPVEVGQNLGDIELALRRVKDLGREAGNAILPGVSEALLKIEQMESVLKTGKGFAFTGYTSPEQIGAGKAKLETAYRQTVAAGANVPIIGSGVAGEAVDFQTVLREQLTAAREGLAYAQFFAENLKQAGGLAAELLTVEAKTIILGRQRNEALQKAIAAEELRNYVALSPAERAARPGAQSAQLAAIQRVATASVEAELAQIAEVERAEAEGKAARTASVNNRIAVAQRQAAAAVEAEALIEQEVSLAEAEGKALHTASINNRIAVAQRQAAAAYEAQALIEEQVVAAEAEGKALRKAAINQQIAAAQRVATASVEAEFAVLEQTRTGVFTGGAGGRGGKGPGFLGGLSGGDNGDFAQFTGSRLRSSAAFFLSGVAIFAVVDQLRNAIKATGELEKEFGVIQTMLTQFGESDQFEHIKDQVLDLSVTTATAASEVAKVERQLAGVFANQQTGAPNFPKAEIETDTATRFARVTGEKFTEIVDDFSAIAVSFAADQAIIHGGFRQIANDALALGQQLGVPDAAIIKFASDIAPLAASLGFTAKQLEGLGAVAIQASGRSASGLAEQIGRALAGLQDKFPQLIELFGQAGATGGDVIKQLGEAFGKGDIPGVLKILVENYTKLNRAQVENLALIVGGRREAGSFYALLERGALTLKALNEGFATPEADLLDQRFAKVTETITFQFDQAKIAVQRFLIELLDSGVGDALTTLAGDVKTIADALALLIGLASPFFSSWVGQIAAVTGEIVLLVKGFEALQRVILATKIGAALFPGGGVAAAGAEAGFFGGFGARFAAGSGGGFGIPGGTAGGLLSAFATPITAIIAGAIAIHQLQGAIEQRGQVAQAGAGVTDAALTQLQLGTSIDEIRRRADTGEPGGVRGLAADTYNTIFGQKDTGALITDAQQIFDNPKKLAQLQALQGTRGDINADIGFGERKRLSELIADLTAHPEADDLNNFADALIAQQTDPAVQKTLADVGARAEAQAKEGNRKAVVLQQAVGRLADPSRQRALSDLQNDFAKGNAGPEAIDKLLKGRVDDLTLAIEAATAPGGKPVDDADIQKLRDEKDKLEKELDDNIKSSVLGPLDFARKLREALGQTPGGTDADLKQSINDITNAAATLSSTGNLDVSTEQGFVIDAINALKDRRKAEADAAETALEKDAILNKPIPVPSEIQRLAVDVQLRQGVGADAVKAFSDATGLTLDAARNQIVDTIVQLGDDQQAIKAALTKLASQAYVRYQVELDRLLKISGTGENDARVAQLKAAMQSLVDNFDLTTPVDPTETEATKQFKLTALQNELKQLQLIVGTGENDKRVAEIMAEIAALTLEQPIVNEIDPNDFENSKRWKIQVLQNELNQILALSPYIRNQKLVDEIEQKIAALTAAKPPGLLGGLGNLGKIGPSAGDKQKQIDDARAEAEALENANLDIAAARANGDALKLAEIARQRAAISAKYAKTGSERAKALAEMISADNDLVKAQLEYNTALRDLSAAQSGDSPLVVAQNALAAANEAAANASGPIAEANAQAAQIRANKVWASAIQDLADSQTNILIAMREAAGDSVGAAQLKLKELTDRLAITGATLATEDRNKLLAEIVSQSASVVQTIISEGESSIQTDLTLKRITKGQAIAELEALRAKAIATGASQKEIDQIAIEIQNLKGQLGQDFKFNLPSVLGLPTLYEARRLNQTLGATTTSGYNDNRVITVTVVAQTNASPEMIADAVAGAVGGSNVNGTYATRY